AKLYCEAMASLGVECPMESDEGFGSTDMGNVSWRVPSIQPTLKIADGIPIHTREFRDAANSERGYAGMIDAAKAMAFTAIDLMSQPKLLDEARQAFQGALAER
ncbi:MAG: hypothetical protein ACYDAG_18390, partial [Chloroflexota bacterium]